MISTLVPRLKPKHECTVIPQEVCQLKFDTPKQEVVPFMSKWCIDPNEEVVPDSTYDETQGTGSSRLMRISLLRFFKTFQNTWLMRFYTYLANAILGLFFA